MNRWSVGLVVGCGVVFGAIDASGAEPAKAKPAAGQAAAPKEPAVPKEAMLPPTPVDTALFMEGPGGKEGRAGSCCGSAGDTLELATKPLPAPAIGMRHVLASCVVSFTLKASTPAWASSPFDFRVTIMLNGTEVGSTSVADPNAGSHPTELAGTVQCDNQVHAFSPSGLATLTLKVDGNWTARPDNVARNPPDRVTTGKTVANLLFSP